MPEEIAVDDIAALFGAHDIDNEQEDAARVDDITYLMHQALKSKEGETLVRRRRGDEISREYFRSEMIKIIERIK